jgi:very-short-patch-repair endonuclease
VVAQTRFERGAKVNLVLHDGVFVAGYGQVTQQQRWRAATLTTPTTVLSHFSAAACWGFRDNPGTSESVTRPGRGGRLQIGALLVFRSVRLADDVTRRHGFRITTPERTAVDLSPHLDDRQRRKMLREALRLQIVTIPSLEAAVQKHRGRRGTAHIAKLAERYARLHIDRCKSDAEAYAMELLDTSRRPLPAVNQHRANQEADLSWPDHRLIVEIDGPQFHRDKLEDARKTAAWSAAGWTVRRIDSDDIFHRPERLLALAPPYTNSSSITRIARGESRTKSSSPISAIAS